MMRTVFSVLLVASFSLATMAQSGTNSPYSMYGFGVITDQSVGYNRGMNGVGIALRERSQVNYLNPASYSNIDSLTFVFDVAASLQATSFKENGTSKTARNADFEYAVGGFRVLRHLGMGFGVMPYTNIGYDFSTSGTVSGYHTYPQEEATTQFVRSFSGSGGLHEVFVGLGWQPFQRFSVGFNASYLWGRIDRAMVATFDDTSVGTLANYESAQLRNYKLTFGATYTVPLAKERELTIGATFTPGHKVGNVEYTRYSVVNSVADTLKPSPTAEMKIPTQVGIGFGYKQGNSWKVALDYTLQHWGGMQYPVFSNTKKTYIMSDLYSDRHKFNIGAEYIKNPNGRNFIDRMRWRAGVGYATSYMKINGYDGPDELTASLGFGIPIINTYNNRSVLNIALQYARQSADNLIKENTFRIHIGLTFNERWFSKWKFE